MHRFGVTGSFSPHPTLVRLACHSRDFGARPRRRSNPAPCPESQVTTSMTGVVVPLHQPSLHRSASWPHRARARTRPRARPQVQRTAGGRARPPLAGATQQVTGRAPPRRGIGQVQRTAAATGRATRAAAWPRRAGEGQPVGQEHIMASRTLWLTRARAV